MASPTFPTAEEERDLIRRAQSGDLMAEAEMVARNEGLASRWAKRYVRRSVAGREYADMLSEANLGLLEAVRGFDLARGVRFSTHATWRIRNQMTQATRVKAANVGTTLSYAGDEDYDVIGQAEDHRESAADAGAERADTTHLAHAFLASLKPREAEVLRLRYGIGSDGGSEASPLTLLEAGRRLGISRERVRQLEQRAIRKLKSRVARAARAGRTADDPGGSTP